MIPNLKGIGDECEELMLRVRRVSSCCFEQGTPCAEGPARRGWAGKGPVRSMTQQQNSLFTSASLGRADMQGFSGS